MLPQQLQQIQSLQSNIPLIAAGVFGFSIVLMLIAVYYFRKSRTDFYWRRRRAAGQRGWRIFVASVFLMLFSGIACMVTGVMSLVASARNGATPTLIVTAIAAVPTASITPTTNNLTNTTVPSDTPDLPTSTHTETATDEMALMPTSDTSTAIIAAASRAPTQVIILKSPTPKTTQVAVQSTATRKPTSTPTVTPTKTPVPATAIPTTGKLASTSDSLASSVTPNADAKLTITALDSQLSADSGPVAATTKFKAGITRIYYFVTFSKMQSGVLWRRQLVANNKVIQEADYLWGLAQDGTAYFFFGQEGGLKPGQYAILLFLGEATSPISAMKFTVTP
jgi:hypothetical protein